MAIVITPSGLRSPTLPLVQMIQEYVTDLGGEDRLKRMNAYNGLLRLLDSETLTPAQQIWIIRALLAAGGSADHMFRHAAERSATIIRSSPNVEVAILQWLRSVVMDNSTAFSTDTYDWAEHPTGELLERIESLG